MPMVPSGGLTRTMIERNVTISTIVHAIPAEVGLGFHLRFGTLGGWPRFAPDDLSGAVTLANAVIEHSGRRVDWVHLPVLDTSEDRSSRRWPLDAGEQKFILV